MFQDHQVWQIATRSQRLRAAWRRLRPSRCGGATSRYATVALFWLALSCSPAAWASKCLFISSYHQGYAWSDGVERGLRAVLEGQCELKQFELDAKRRKEIHDIQQQALRAKQLIETWQPDVVITADDDAAQYLIMPFFKDHALPFVFCGINWTVKEYGFPYTNTTGMIEVAPIEPLFEQARMLVPAHTRALYLGANTSTEVKNLERTREVAERRGVHLEARLVDTLAAWLTEFRAAQHYDFIILGSNSGINDWDDARARQGVSEASRRLSLTTHEWMMPFTMLGLTKVPEEQGEWAARAALQIVQGSAPSSIPIIPNRKWDIWVNTALTDTIGITLPKPLLAKAKKVQ
ncbi:MAG: ABC transporter substrate-binding protein [Candidatus Tectimicrobiota bacterium]